MLLLIAFFANAMPKEEANKVFEENQMQYDRVEDALKEKEDHLIRLCEAKDITYPPDSLFIRAFKQEAEFEVWAYSEDIAQFVLLKSYPICKISGELGPKRQEGDYQTPEGFYEIEVFNPVSNFHLSMGINYPNKSDKILGVQGSLGGEIYIHGACATVGCLPMTDDYIKEIYILTMKAKGAGQTAIPVHIFPAKMTFDNLVDLYHGHADNPGLLHFWKDLKKGYDYFEKYKVLPNVTVDEYGMYHILPA